MKPKSKVEEKKNPPQKTRNQKAADKAKNPQPNMKSNPFEAFDKKADMERRKNCGEESESEDEVPLLNSSHKKIYSGTMNPDDEDMDTESSEAEDYDDEEEDIVKDELNDLKELKKKIDNMPLAKALEMKEKLGLKLWNMIQNGDVEETVKNSNEDLDEGSDDEAPTETTTKRSKNAPREMSWKKPVSVLRNIEFADSNYERRRFDPRFEKKSGQFIESEFARDYGFLHELQQNDLKTLQTEMKKNKSNPSKYQQLKNVSMKLKQQLTSQREKQFWSETKAELKQKNIERMNAGMKPIFVSNKNLEKMIAEKRLQWQVAAGKGDKYEKNRQKRLEKKQGRKNVLGIN
uniref:rRNA biogenesis protein RRP36 n=1 Tax=Panagrolaimus sp. JU765 TaxID=591449 RepID=A0AC34Q8H3_9BILA